MKIYKSDRQKALDFSEEMGALGFVTEIKMVDLKTVPIWEVTLTAMNPVKTVNMFTETAGDRR